MARRILLAGAGGQLGRSLREVLADRELHPRTRDELDIASLDAVRDAVAQIEPDLVVNAAAYNAVDAAEEDPEAAYSGNALGPRNLAVATAGRAIPLLHVSTDYVFDGRGARPYHEYDRPAPRTAYGKSKLAGEDAVRSINPRHYIVRTAWLYHPDGKNFANTIVGLADRGEVRVVSDQYGSPTYVPHLATGIAQLVDSEAYGTYHIVNAGEASWFDFASALYAELDLDAAVLPVSTAEFPRPAERPRYSVLTSIQQPRVELPHWKDGVRAFAAAKRG